MENINRKHCLKVACNQLIYIRKHLQYLLKEEENIKSSAVNLLVYKDVHGKAKRDHLKECGYIEEEMDHAKEEIISNEECHLDVILKSGLPQEIIDDIACRVAEESKAIE